MTCPARCVTSNSAPANRSARRSRRRRRLPRPASLRGRPCYQHRHLGTSAAKTQPNPVLKTHRSSARDRATPPTQKQPLTFPLMLLHTPRTNPLSPRFCSPRHYPFPRSNPTLFPRQKLARHSKHAGRMPALPGHCDESVGTTFAFISTATRPWRPLWQRIQRICVEFGPFVVA